MKLLANPYALIAAGVLFLLAVAASYLQGRADGRAVVNAQAARAMKKAMDAIELRRVEVDRLNGRLAIAQTAQSTETREIFHESVKIIDRPVLRTVCGDADTSELLARARRSANAGFTGQPDGPAPGVTRDAP